MVLKKIGIKDLRLGMFVSELDISWVKSPFFRHKRLILKQDDIELLKKAGVESLVIDITKSKFGMNATTPTGEAVEADELEELENEVPQPEAVLHVKEEAVDPLVQKAKPKPLMKAPKVALEKEFKIAKIIQSEVLQAVEELQNACERGHGVSLEKVNPVVEKTLQSIDNNSQAIMALLHEGRDGGKIAIHSFGVFALVLLLSNHLDFSLEDQQQLGLAALTHDAGWTKLPSHLMSKGKPYTIQEKKLVRQHIPIVTKMLQGQPQITPNVVTAVEQHHEFLDGSGYPKQLKGDEIHSWAKILAACNEYDEMVHGLGENPGMTPQNALSALFQLCQKGKLDPYFTTNLISLLGVYPLGSAVELTDKRLGVVVEIHHRAPLQPTVKIFYDSSGLVLAKVVRVNLEKESLKINRVLDILGKDKSIDPKRLLAFSGDMLQ